MKDTRVIICSDLHLCKHPISGGDPDWMGRSAEERMDNFVEKMNEYYEKAPYEKVVFLGDYSLDHEIPPLGTMPFGPSDTERFIKDYASRLKTPYYMIPGNHEQYGYGTWLRMVGTSRQSAFTVGGYLFVCLDNYQGILDPEVGGNGQYTPTDLSFVKKKMEEYPNLPVILCSHFFELGEESEEFFDLLKNEKRIVCLFCGHDHRAAVTELGERADGVCMYHDGHYSFSGHCYGGHNEPLMMWGFCDVLLTEKGVKVFYFEPENTVTFRGETVVGKDNEKIHAFFPRRDI